MKRELIKRWRNSGFALSLYETFQTDNMGGWRQRTTLTYRFSDEGKIIFEGSDFCPSPCHAIDSLSTVYALLSFLALRPGDTDAEYFDDYTPAQLAWRDSGRAEFLNMIVIEGEEREQYKRLRAEGLSKDEARAKVRG